MSFAFLDPGSLVDDDLELIAPAAQWIEHVLATCRHELTLRGDPAAAGTTRLQLQQFLNLAPGGHQVQETTPERSAAYHFWMICRGQGERPPGPWAQRLRRWTSRPPAEPLIIAGGIGLRIGNGRELELYSGHFGYHVYPPFRGHHYAERACRLLLPLARRHGMNRLWITCNPDNIASRRTCERLGAKLIEVVPIPEGHEFYRLGERQKCRYLLDLA
jgi:predicted acetyltransferase